jgi:hypothetical protein
MKKSKIFTTLILLLMVAIAMPSVVSAGMREDWQSVAAAVAATGQFEAAARIKAAVNALSDAELESVYGGADLAALTDAFTATGQAFSDTDQAFGASLSQRASLKADAPRSMSPGFPEAVGYPTTFLCPFSPDRSDADALLIAVDAIAIARTALEVAKGVWSGLSRACEQVAVVPPGAGGNASLACIPVDVVLFVAEGLVGIAEGVVENIDFCDAAVDAAEIEGSYERLGHLHTDVAEVQTTLDDETRFTDDSELAVHEANLSTHDTDIKTVISLHDINIDSDLATHDADIKNLLAAIQATVSENGQKLDTLLERQLEAIRLLHTPSGRRESEVPACNGGPCDWPSKK